MSTTTPALAEFEREAKEKVQQPQATGIQTRDVAVSVMSTVELKATTNALTAACARAVVAEQYRAYEEMRTMIAHELAFRRRHIKEVQASYSVKPPSSNDPRWLDIQHAEREIEGLEVAVGALDRAHADVIARYRQAAGMEGK